jgi:transcriptional regulator of met regulon
MDNPRTRPEAQVKDLGTESVQVKGRTYSCRVNEVQVHAVFGEPLPSTEDLRLRTSVNAEIPGGTVKIFLQRKSPTHSMELSSQVVEFQAVRRDKQ